jgi:hypothetical protein
MLWILHLLRTKIRAVARYMVRGVITTLCCAFGVGALTEAAAIVGVYLGLWKQIGMQPPWPIVAGLTSLSVPLVMMVMGVVALVGLLIVSVGAVFQLLGNPSDPNDVLNQVHRVVEIPPRHIGPPITLINEKV